MEAWVAYSPGKRAVEHPSDETLKQFMTQATCDDTAKNAQKNREPSASFLQLVLGCCHFRSSSAEHEILRHSAAFNARLNMVGAIRACKQSGHSQLLYPVRG
jgi:hypothetical protein